MKRALICMCMILCIAAVAADAFAAQTYTEYTLECEGNAIGLSQQNGKNYFMVPGSWQGRSIVVRTEIPLWINGIGPYYDGDKAPELLNEEIWQVRAGKENASSVYVYIRVGSSLPALFVKTESGGLHEIHSNKDVKEKGYFSLFYPMEQYTENILGGELEYIKCRGNTTFAHPKKPYQIKLMEKESLCRMQAAKKWVLLADYWDVSLLRNRITLDLAKAVGMPFSIDCEHVDVYINGQYRGLYLLCEKIEIGSHSVDIVDMEDAQKVLNTKPLNEFQLNYHKMETGGGSEFTAYRAYEGMNNPADITGGYLLECDKLYRFYNGNETGIVTGNGMAVTIKEPQYASYEMVMYIGSKVNAFHRALLTSDGVDPETGLRWDEIVDLESLAQKYLIEEFTENYDAMVGSQYFYKDVDAVSEKIFAGPCWDYDLTFGNAQHSPRRLYLRSDENDTQYWYSRLHRFDFFWQRVEELWRETYSPFVHGLLGENPDSGMKTIEEYADNIRMSAEMNFIIWPISRIEGRHPATGNSFRAAVICLEEYVGERMKYLDRSFIECTE